MKEFYNKPEIEITMFETEDVITTSFGDGGEVEVPDGGEEV
nr:hypothetical protein [uncultured Fusobacterium sp.]